MIKTRLQKNERKIKWTRLHTVQCGMRTVRLARDGQLPDKASREQQLLQLAFLDLHLLAQR